MPAYKTGTYRPLNGHYKHALNERQVQELLGSANVDDELWIILEYYSEVQSVGMELLKRSGIKHSRARKRLFDNFQAYIRQAKNYYYSAKTLPPKSSGLLYYYCFLNLAKAAILLKYPEIAGAFITHGLSYKISNNSPLSKQAVSLPRREGVFHKLYDWYFDASIPPKTFNIETLLTYCTDIAYQNQMAGIHQTKIISAYFAHAADNPRKKNWGIIGFYDLDEVSKYKKTMRQFFDQFELIDLPTHIAKEVFDVSAPEARYISFFQSIQ